MKATIQDINLRMKAKGLKLSNHKSDFTNTDRIVITDAQVINDHFTSMGKRFNKWLMKEFIHTGMLARTPVGNELAWIITEKPLGNE